jgi:TATA-box binding protein (TBP) (component of TFIID and TFIIIB)
MSSSQPGIPSSPICPLSHDWYQDEAVKRYKTDVIFPGLIHRMKEPKVVMLIFSSGKLVCTGASREADVEKAVSKLREALTTKGLIPYSA